MDSFSRLFFVIFFSTLIGCSHVFPTQKAAIATAHPLATQAGLDILKQGGNAFDAAELPPVECPALVITGGDDKMTPAKAGIAVAQMLPNAHVANLPSCGHSMLTEQPNQVLDALSGFILS